MLEGTYLVWVDCAVLLQSSDEIVKNLLEKEKLWVNEGGMEKLVKVLSISISRVRDSG